MPSRRKNKLYNYFYSSLHYYPLPAILAITAIILTVPLTIFINSQPHVLKQHAQVLAGPHDSCNTFTFTISETSNCIRATNFSNVCYLITPAVINDVRNYEVDITMHASDNKTHTINYTTHNNFCDVGHGKLGTHSPCYCVGNEQITTADLQIPAGDYIFKMTRSSPSGKACGTYQEDFDINAIDGNSNCNYHGYGAGNGNNPMGAEGLCETGTDCPPTSITPTQAVSPTPTNTPTSGTTGTGTPTTSGNGTNMTTTVLLHGEGKGGDNVNPNSGGNTTPQHATKTLIITLLDASNNPVSTQQGNVVYNASSGNFSGTKDMGSLQSGSYLVRIAVDGFLSKQAPGIVTVSSSNPTIALPSVSLVAGDINNDGQLDILDYNILIGCFGSKQSTSSCLQPPTTTSAGADINDDGTVDGIDYNLFIRELSVQKGGGGNPTPTPSTTPSLPTATSGPNPTTPPGTLSPLHVQGNKLINANNQTVVLRGVAISGTETNCVQSGGIFTNPATPTGVQAMLTWHIHVVRIPLNEDCWLGINGANPGGTVYQQAISNYVNLLNQNGMYAILDLHWNAPGTTKATSQQKMADADHSPAFWTSVATTFKGNNSVIFDLYNEPNSIPDSCILNGGSCGGPFVIAGMQQLVNAIRATGATNVLMVGGNRYTNDLTHWLANKPTDTMTPPNIAASWHVYNYFQFLSVCIDVACYNSTLAPVAAQVPIIAGEIGEGDCAHSFIDLTMNWFDSQQQSYIGWAWINSSCGGFPSLITDFAGTPTGYGAGLKAHLLTFP